MWPTWKPSRLPGKPTTGGLKVFQDGKDWVFRGRRMLLVIAALLALSLAACGDDDDDGGGEGGGASTEELKAYDPGTKTQGNVDYGDFPAKKAKRPYVVGVLFPHFKDPYWIDNAYGAEQEGKKLGVKSVRTLAATGYGDVTTQLQQIDTMIAQGVDGVIFAAVDLEGMGPAVDRLWNEGIPVIYDPVIADSEKVMGVFTNEKLAGRMQGEYIASKDPNAKVIAMCGPPGVIWPKLRCEGLREALEEKAPNAEILAEKFHDMDRAKIATVAGDTLQGNPDANWVFNSTDLQAKGVIDALRAAGKEPGEVKITNLTMGRELVDLMKDGWIAYAISERSVLLGRLAMDQMVRVLNGENEGAPARWEIRFLGFEGNPEDINRFLKEESQNHWSPPGFTPKGY
jgi:ABC-type sugar transport system substrate-binding protein